MRLDRDVSGVAIEDFDGHIYISDGGRSIALSPDDLRWLCLVAGPALLNELAKGEPR